MSEPLLDPSMIAGRYEVLQALGSGGEARVVKALDHQHGRTVALKIRQVRDALTRDELLNEARLLLGLAPHPALPLVREDFFVDEEYVVAMDWVDGTDLARILAERGAPGLAPSSVVAYLAEAAEALMFLHAQDPPIVHGDIKPANLILTRGGHVKLVDFGLSSTPLMLGRRSGTPGYRAPELATGDPPSRASDVYGLAATAFALLTGSAPQGILPAWEGIDPALAEQLESAIRQGLATNPSHRPATPGEFVERLRAGWGATLPTGVTTFCLSDIVGSTALWERDPRAMAAALVRHDELIAGAVESHGGRFLKSKGEGDATFSVFESAPSAVTAAVAATRALDAEAWPDDMGVAVRFGIHTGEAQRRNADYFGPTVNLAARVRGLAEGGEILLSQLAAELSAGHLPDGCSLVDLGPHRVRGVEEPQTIHAVAGPGLAAPSSQCPYRGLLAFDADDSAFYFGREDVLRTLVERLAAGRLLALVGASGSGKSSLLRAGLVAAVQAGEVSGVATTRLLQPGAHPPERLEGDAATLVVVDQFEELYTLCSDAEARQQFLDALLAHPGPVVIGVRADFYGELSAHAQLADAVAANQVLLGAMSDDALRRAVTEPARLAGLRLEPGLVDVVLGEVSDEPGALPLLSHALRATWERRDGRTLSIDAYRASGGVASAIAQTADSVVESLPPDRQGLIRNVFLRMTELGEGLEDTRRRVAVDELVPQDASPAEVQSLLNRLADARLVTLGEGTAEVAHEVLIRAWPTLRRWLDDDRASIRVHRQLGDAARLWDVGGREPGDLYRGTRLGAAVDWAQVHPDALNATERAFLDSSLAESERERRAQLRANRRLRALLAAAGVLLAAAVVTGLLALQESDNSRDSARTADAQRLGAQALIDDRLDRSLLLAQVGRALDDSVATRGNLLSALLRHPAAVGVMQGDGAPLSHALALSPDGRILAAGYEDGPVLLFDTRTRERIGRPLEPEHPAGEVDFSPDGRLLAVSSTGVTLFDLTTRKAVTEIDVGPYPGRPELHIAVEARFSDDGRTLIVIVGPTGEKIGPYPPYVRRYDARTGRPLGPAAAIGRWLGIQASTVPSRRDRLLFTTIGDKRSFEAGRDEDLPKDATFVVDASTLRVRRRVPEGGYVVGLSPDGRSAALGGEDGGVAILDLRTGARRTLAGRHEGRVHGLEFSADGRTLASRADDGRVLLWDLRTGAVRETLTGHTGPVTNLLVSGDGRTLYTAGIDGRVIIWDIAGDRRLARPFQATPLQRYGVIDWPPPLAISPSGRIIATGLRGGGVRLHDVRTLRRLRDLPGAEDGQAVAVEFSPDGRAIAVTGERGAVEVRDAATGRRVRPALRGLGPGAQAMAFTPDGDTLAVADREGSLRVLDLKTGAVRRTTQLGGFTIHLSFSADGRTLAIGIGDRGAELRDTRSLRVVARIRNRGGAGWVRFSPDGRLLAVSSPGGHTQLWDAAGRRRIGPPMSGHEGPVLNAEFSPDGRTLATTGFDGTAILWDVDSRRVLGTLAGFFGATSARFTHDGRRLFVLRETGEAQRWEVSPGAWSKHACRVASRELTRAEWDEFVPDQDYRPVCGGS